MKFGKPNRGTTRAITSGEAAAIGIDPKRAVVRVEEDGAVSVWRVGVSNATWLVLGGVAHKAETLEVYWVTSGRRALRSPKDKTPRVFDGLAQPWRRVVETRRRAGRVVDVLACGHGIKTKGGSTWRQCDRCPPETNIPRQAPRSGESNG